MTTLKKTATVEMQFGFTPFSFALENKSDKDSKDSKFNLLLFHFYLVLKKKNTVKASKCSTS